MLGFSIFDFLLENTMYFCDDVDLFPWEPGIFLETAFAHQAIVHKASGTLTGTALVMGSAVLGQVSPGMIAAVTLADDSLTQLLEVVSVPDSTHATVSALRGRAAEDAIPAFAGGSVKVTVVTFRPQIAAVGDALMALLGIASDRNTEPTPAYEKLGGFRMAATFATLAAVYRHLADGTAPNSTAYAKKSFYELLAHSSRRAIAATIDLDGDGIPETLRRADVPELTRA